MIVAKAALADFFEQAVRESLQACRVEATAGTATYLVTLLEDFARPDGAKEETLERPLSLLLDEALHAPNPAERFEKLRAIGDGVLYSAGFFADHFERRGVDAKFVCTLGARAYGSVSAMLGAPQTMDVFAELAGKFEAFVLVISDVADRTAAAGASRAKDVLKLYERWLKTGSERLAEALGEQGLAPTRAVKGVH
jgi:hypothetical protein